jgi:hypothetical protein
MFGSTERIQLVTRGQDSGMGTTAAGLNHLLMQERHHFSRLHSIPKIPCRSKNTLLFT